LRQHDDVVVSVALTDLRRVAEEHHGLA
jgi:hypothetical protein